jgi:SAM-dependent methyltransferase
MEGREPATTTPGSATAKLRRMVVAVQPLDRASLCALLARYLVGDGVELGPGHSPFPIPYPGTNVRYVDRWVPDTNRELFPELGEAATFPMPDIIADLDTDRLSALDDESQDFVIASHVLEHLANPLAMLGEIQRVLRSRGVALVLLPDRRRTFDRARRPTPVQHLVAEYEADVTTVSDDHLEDFLRGVGEWHDDWSADARTEAIERHRQRSFHVHCWNEDEFSETLLHVIETGRQQWDLLDAVFVEDVVDSIEFGYVLRKLPADRDPQLVSARFREVLANLRAQSSTDPQVPARAGATRSAPTTRVAELLRGSPVGEPLSNLRRRGRAMVARLR